VVEVPDADAMQLVGLVVRFEGGDHGQPIPNVSEHSGAWQLGSY
jgi:hypothetical protein